MPYQIKYPEFIADEVSGIQVRNRDREVAKEPVEDYIEYLRQEFARILAEQEEQRRKYGNQNRVQ